MTKHTDTMIHRLLLIPVSLGSERNFVSNEGTSHNSNDDSDAFGKIPPTFRHSRIARRLYSPPVIEIIAVEINPRAGG